MRVAQLVTQEIVSSTPARPVTFRVLKKLRIKCCLCNLYLYISSCHKAHKALTFSFHPLQFAAKALTVVHDCHPATRLSSSTILLHVVFGRPGLLLPSGLHSNAVTQCSSLFFLNICPIQFHLRRLISSLVLFTPVVSWICWCEMVRGHLILSMRFMHLYWKASSFFASVFVSFQASQPYIKTALTIVLSNLTFVFLPL